ncbi:hypothetical protein LBMAG52_33900 [Planctomycetia bacterium]|nr:hypothetical protein LBMAG52_33900 [Planctomycetia bacterium]
MVEEESVELLLDPVELELVDPPDVELPLPVLLEEPVELPDDEVDPLLVLPVLDDEASSVEEVNAESRNTTARRSVSIRRNKARATCERSISTWPSADDDQCICNAVYNAANNRLAKPRASTISNNVKPRDTSALRERRR